jgi:hypothetical protein
MVCLVCCLRHIGLVRLCIVFQDDWGLSIPSPLAGKTLVKWRKNRSNDLLNIDGTIDTLPFGG